MNNSIYDSLKNPKSFRWQSILFFIFAIVGIFTSLEYILSFLPETGKVASHWDFAGKANDWEDVSSTKNFFRGLTTIILSFIFLLMSAIIFTDNSEFKAYRGKLLEKYSKLKRVKIFLIGNLSKLDWVILLVLFVAFLILIIAYFVVLANQNKNCEMPAVICYVCLFIISMIFMPIFLWEPTRKK